MTLAVALRHDPALPPGPEGGHLFAGDNAALLPGGQPRHLALLLGPPPMEGLLLVGATYFQAINRARIASLLTAGAGIGGFLRGFPRGRSGSGWLAHLQHRAGTGDVAGHGQGGRAACRSPVTSAPFMNEKASPGCLFASILPDQV